LYASGLALSNITGLASRALSIVNGLAGTAMAMWLYHNFVGWLTFLSAAIPPVGGVIIADYLLRRRRYAEYPGKAAVVINVPAFVAVVAGLACGHLLPGIVPVNAVLGAMATYAFRCDAEGPRRSPAPAAQRSGHPGFGRLGIHQADRCVV